MERLLGVICASGLNVATDESLDVVPDVIPTGAPNPEKAESDSPVTCPVRLLVASRRSGRHRR